MEEITLSIGERTTVVLPGLGTAGYRWSAAVDNPAVVSVEALGTGAAVSEPGRTGSRDEQFSLKAVGLGDTVVRFQQARQFEPGKPPHAARDIQVHVS